MFYDLWMAVLIEKNEDPVVANQVDMENEDEPLILPILYLGEFGWSHWKGKWAHL